MEPDDCRLARLATEAAFKTLGRRKGFDNWWGNIESEEIRKDVELAVYGAILKVVRSPNEGNTPEPER